MVLAAYGNVVGERLLRGLLGGFRLVKVVQILPPQRHY